MHICIEELMNRIGLNLHSIRSIRKETLQGVSKSFGISHPVLSKIENGRYSTLQVALLARLCNHYEITLQQVISLEKPQIFQVFQDNNDRSKEMGGQELLERYEQSISQYKSEIAWLRSLVERLKA